MPDTPDRDAVRPATPLQLRPSTWRYLLRRAGVEFVRDECLDAAGALTFFGVLAVFPAGLAIMAIIGIVGDSEDVRERLLSLLSQVVPEAVVRTSDTILTNITSTSGADITLVVSVAVAVWSSSIYVSAFGRSVNRIWGVPEGRPYWKRKPAQLGLTVILLLTVITMIGVVMISGPTLSVLGEAWGIGDTALRVWEVVRWVVFGGALVVVITILYRGTGNVRVPRLGWLGVGALLAVLVGGAASLGFGFYISNFGRYNETFGTFAGVTIFLIWLFLINVALLLGVELNAEIERGRELQSGTAAEDRLHLEMRDTTAYRRRETSARITREQGTAIRLGEKPGARPDTLLSRARRLLAAMKDRMSSHRP